jgi:hypothetical protein
MDGVTGDKLKGFQRANLGALPAAFSFTVSNAAVLTVPRRLEPAWFIRRTASAGYRSIRTA